jgi:outer membrane lipoprotein-sorting protein
MRKSWPAAIIAATLASLAGSTAWTQSVPAPRSRPATAPVAQNVPRPPVSAASELLAQGPRPTISRPPAAATRPGGTTAFDDSQRAVVEKVNNYLSNLRMLTGRFVQVGPDGGRSEGDFYLQKPGKVRFEYDPPSVIQLISDGQSVVVRDRKLATQDLYPLSQTPLRFLLVDRIDLLRDTILTGVYADDVFVTVVIEEKQTFGGTHRLMLMFGAKDLQLKQWTVTDPQGYDTTVAVYNLDTTKRPDPSLFKINYERILQ